VPRCFQWASIIPKPKSKLSEKPHEKSIYCSRNYYAGSRTGLHGRRTRIYILKTGKVIHLRTAPIDPRDIFRGDYVRLNYEISRIAIDDLKDAEDFEEIKKGQKRACT
jgi:hypothetical protein